jgi:hypothetical protein
MTTPNIGDVRRHAEEVIRGLEIFTVPKIEALLHILRYVQAEQVVFDYHQPVGSMASYQFLRTHQDILRHLIYKIHEWCPEGGDMNCLTRREDMRRAKAAVDMFLIYSTLQEFLENVEGKFCTYTITGSCVQFDSIMSASFMARMIDDAKDRVQVIDLEESPEVARLKIRTAFGRKIEFLRNASVRYTVTDSMFSLFYHNVPPSLFPSDLNLGEYTWNDYHTFWLYIKALCDLRHWVLTAACAQLEGQSTAHNSAAIFIETGELKKIRHRVGLRYEPAKAILRDLTYSDLARDIIHQPLIRLTEEVYVTAPLLVYGSNHERNLLPIVNKLSDRSGQALNEVKEQIMLEELQPLFVERGLHVRPRLRLGKPPREIGDIDLLVWNDDASVAFAISLKWFLGPDSTFEVRKHDEKFRDALAVHKRCLLELEATKTVIARNFALNPPFTSSTKILGAIVSKMARPTDLVSDEEIPIVTSDELKDCLKDADLFALFDELRRVPEKLTQVKGRDIYKEVRFGEYLIKFPQFVPDKD